MGQIDEERRKGAELVLEFLNFRSGRLGSLVVREAGFQIPNPRKQKSQGIKSFDRYILSESFSCYGKRFS